MDLPAPQVHELLKQAKAEGPQTFALLYVLFGAGLSAAEISQLQQHHQVMDSNQCLLQILETERLVPVNQWILGKRYGSVSKNPLTQWLKGRKDESPSLFIQDVQGDVRDVQGDVQDRDGVSLAMMPETIESIWQRLWQRSLAASSADPAENALVPPLSRAQQTWRIDMLMRGISVENLSLLSGLPVPALQPYVQRAKLKKAIKQAVVLDRKSGA